MGVIRAVRREKYERKNFDCEMRELVTYLDSVSGARFISAVIQPQKELINVGSKLELAKMMTVKLDGNMVGLKVYFHEYREIFKMELYDLNHDPKLQRNTSFKDVQEFKKFYDKYLKLVKKLRKVVL